MSIREISFPSANGRDTIKAWAYTPLGKPEPSFSSSTASASTPAAICT